MNSRFTSQITVRPDDIDMNQHVHYSRYFDYVLAARYDQMARCYGLSMEEFQTRGYTWFVRTAHFDYKRPLKLGDTAVVTTWVDSFSRHGVQVKFEVTRIQDNKSCGEGYCDYTLISLATGRATALPVWAIEQYSV